MIHSTHCFPPSTKPLAPSSVNGKNWNCLRYFLSHSQCLIPFKQQLFSIVQRALTPTRHWPCLPSLRSRLLNTRHLWCEPTMEIIHPRALCDWRTETNSISYKWNDILKIYYKIAIAALSFGIMYIYNTCKGAAYLNLRAREITMNLLMSTWVYPFEQLCRIEVAASRTVK